MSVCAMAMVAASTAVRQPMIATSAEVPRASWNSAFERATM